MKSLLAILSVVVLFASGIAHGQSYFLFGTPPRTNESPAYGLSDDGRVAVGWSLGGSFYPGYRWTQATGRVDFAGVNGSPENSLAFGISGDGEWAVGVGYRQGPRVNEAFRYRPATQEFQFLGRLAGWQDSRSLDASFDGSVVVGWAHERGQSFGRAFRWTESGGMRALDQPAPEYFSTKANAVSSDGSITVGWASNGDNSDAMNWDADGRATILQRLNDLGDPQLSGGQALSVSSNGRFIVGNSGQARQMTIWENGVPRGLGTFENRNTNALGVSDDGTVVVGQSGLNEALIWTQDRGLERLSMYLVYHGINLPPGFQLYRASAVSSDGRSILALAMTPWGTGEGMLFHIPSPSSFTILVFMIAVRRRR